MDRLKQINSSESNVVVYVVTKEEVHEQLNNERLLGLLPVFILLVIIFIRVLFVIYKNKGQKTRSPQQRRAYVASRTRASLSQSEPTIYVSPSNLPPPPKYEAMAPPSYEEVVGIHYPNYQPHIQPITQPLTTALAQTTNSTSTNVAPTNMNDATNDKNETNNCPSTVITVTTEDSRTSVTVATS